MKRNFPTCTSWQVSSRSHAVLEVLCVNEPAAPTEGEEGEEGEASGSDDMGTATDGYMHPSFLDPNYHVMHPNHLAGTMTTKITFVDLAGSERLKRTVCLAFTQNHNGRVSQIRQLARKQRHEHRRGRNFSVRARKGRGREKASPSTQVTAATCFPTSQHTIPAHI